MAQTHSGADVAQLRRQLQDLLDRNAIVDLISRLGLMLDDKRFDDIGSIYADDVVAIFGFAAGARIEGVEALAERGRKSQGRFARAHHVFTDHVIDLRGDQAIVRANLIGIHVHRAEDPASHFDMGERYTFEMIRKPEGWRIAKVITTPVWTAGPPPA